MHATLMRLLGAFAPNSRDGTKYGAAIAAVAAVVFRKLRREIFVAGRCESFIALPLVIHEQIVVPVRFASVDGAVPDSIRCRQKRQTQAPAHGQMSIRRRPELATRRSAASRDQSR